MAFVPERVRKIAINRRSVVVAGFSLIGFVILGLLLAGPFGAARSIQIVVTLFVPSTVMVGFWLIASERLASSEARIESEIELETLGSRALAEFVAGVAHELVAHPARCNLRAEALAVAVDYRHFRPGLKVAVPDVVVVTDPHLLRQILHVLVGNAVRHGGERVAVWAAPDGDRMRLSVSDDGPGIPAGIEARVFDRYVDLAPQLNGRRPTRAGLPLARTLSELIGADLKHRRDSTWTHFSIRLQMELEVAVPAEERLPLEAGVH